MGALDRLQILATFLEARRAGREPDRSRLEARQARLWARLSRHVLPRSPFYAPLAGKPLEAFPVIDKAGWMGAFDEINTAGVRLETALALAEAAERDRGFSRTLNGLAVGLSTGTSGRRGVFLAGPAERRRWAGVVLAAFLPEPLFRRRRTAFFLRADSPLYHAVEGSGRVALSFFDLLEPLERHQAELEAFDPHILAAPAQVLRRLAGEKLAGRLPIAAPERVISFAEVLDPDDRRRIEHAFGPPLHEAYQATEGVIALTCERGRLHLNEAWMHIEPEWLDRDAGRFRPIVTDLTRSAQPVVRYRLDDILTLAPEPCACGRAALTLDAVEGRCDDICLLLDAKGREVPVFPDFITRAVLGAHGDIEDFRVVQTRPGAWEVSVEPGRQDLETAVAGAIGRLAERLGAEAPQVSFHPVEPDPGQKRRRVRVVIAPAPRPSPAVGYCS
jgi:putative adenylate-forming enzyme